MKAGGSLQPEALFSGVWDSPAGALWELGAPGKGLDGLSRGLNVVLCSLPVALPSSQRGAAPREGVQWKWVAGGCGRSREGVKCQQLGRQSRMAGGHCKHLAFVKRLEGNDEVSGQSWEGALS